MTRSRSRPGDGLVAIYPHLTHRDWLLVQLLGDHQVLTTDQVCRLLFAASRTCQLRLVQLRELGVVERFRFVRADGGSFPWKWTLGHNGQRLQAAAQGQSEPTARTARQAVTRLASSPHLTHLVTANEFFVRLAAHARCTPQARLERWWSERRATQEFQRVRPDGHGVWTVGERSTGVFLECDLRTEFSGRLIAKLDAYARLVATDGPRYPVLFWLSSPEREQHLHAALRQVDLNVPTATATLDADPAGPVWLPGDGFERVRLDQLPSFHGRPAAANPNFRDGHLHLRDDPAYPWT